MRVLIAPDKFKGSLTAAAVTDHLAKGLAEAGAHTRMLPHRAPIQFTPSRPVSG